MTSTHRVIAALVSAMTASALLAIPAQAAPTLTINNVTPQTLPFLDVDGAEVTVAYRCDPADSSAALRLVVTNQTTNDTSPASLSLKPCSPNDITTNLFAALTQAPRPGEVLRADVGLTTVPGNTTVTATKTITVP